MDSSSSAVARLTSASSAQMPPWTSRRCSSERSTSHTITAGYATPGVPVPEHLEFDPRDPSPAHHFLEAVHVPCVIKPAAGTGAGSGVTTGLSTREHLDYSYSRCSRPAPIDRRPTARPSASRLPRPQPVPAAAGRSGQSRRSSARRQPLLRPKRFHWPRSAPWWGSGANGTAGPSTSRHLCSGTSTRLVRIDHHPSGTGSVSTHSSPSPGGDALP